MSSSPEGVFSCGKGLFVCKLLQLLMIAHEGSLGVMTEWFRRSDGSAIQQKKRCIMSKMQKWVTAVTFAFLFSNGLVANAAGLPVITNSLVTAVEGTTNSTILMVTSIDGLAITNAPSYSTPSATFLAPNSYASGPTFVGYFTYVAPSVVVTNVSDSFTYNVMTSNGINRVVLQPIAVTAVNDAPVLVSTNISFTVYEDVTNTEINLSTKVTDEEDASTNLTYAINPAGITDGTLKASTTNYMFYFTSNPNTPVAHAITNSFTFTATDKGGLSVSGTANIIILPTSDPTVLSKPNAAIFLDKKIAGVTNSVISLDVTDLDVPQGDNYNTNFTYAIVGASSGAGWSATVSTTGLVSFVVTDTNANISTSIKVAIAQATYALGSDLPVTNTVNLFYTNKSIPAFLNNSPVATSVTIADGQTPAPMFSLTAVDSNTNSPAFGNATLSVFGVSKVVWFVDGVAKQTDSTATLSGGISSLASSFQFSNVYYKLITASTNAIVSAVAYDVENNVTTNTWTVTIASQANQVITIPKDMYEVIVGSNVTVSVSLNTANTNLAWSSTAPTVLSFVKSDGLTATFLALKSGTAYVNVTAPAFEKYPAVSTSTGDITVDVLVPVNMSTATSGGETTTVNSVLVLPAKAAYAVGDTVTLKTVAGAGYVFLKWSGADAGLVSGAGTVASPYTLPIATGKTSYNLVAVFKLAKDLAIPQITDPAQGATLSAVVGAAFSKFVTVATEAGTFTVTSSTLPAGLTLSGNATLGYKLAGTPKTVGNTTVTLTATNDKGTSSVTFVISVAALPTWAIGTFNGAIDGLVINTQGIGSFTVQANGIVSGKYLVSGKTYSDSAASFDAPTPANYDADGTTLISLQYTTKLGNVLVVNKDGTAVIVGQANFSRNVTADYAGYYTLSLTPGGTFGSGYLTLTVTTTVKSGVTNSTVKAAGKLADGTAVSLSTPVFNNETVIYAVPSSYRGGYVWYHIYFGKNAANVTAITACDATYVNGSGYWCNNNPVATDTYGAGFAQGIYAVGGDDLNAVGGYFGTVKDIKTFYANSLTVNADNSQLAYQYDAKDPDAEAYASEVTPNGVVVKAGFEVSKIKTDNASALTIKLNKSGTAVTGVFTGSFMTFFDYENAAGKALSTSKSITYQGILVPVRGDADVDYPEGSGYFLWSRTHVEWPTGGTGGTKVVYKFNESYDFQIVK